MYSGLVAARAFFGLVEGHLFHSIVLFLSGSHTRKELSLRYAPFLIYSHTMFSYSIRHCSVLLYSLSFGCFLWLALCCYPEPKRCARKARMGMTLHYRERARLLWQQTLCSYLNQRRASSQSVSDFLDFSSFHLCQATFVSSPKQNGSKYGISSDSICLRKISASLRNASSSTDHLAHRKVLLPRGAQRHHLTARCSCLCIPLSNGVTLFGLALFLPTIVGSLGFSETNTQLVSVGPFACAFVCGS